jgi:environmental stress-induced protein Ves
MTNITVTHIDPSSYRRIPWKNGGGELVVIASGGDGDWGSAGIPWHFGRTSIVERGPFSDLSGYERLQVVIKGAGLVLETPAGEIDLRQAFMPRRYDGGTPIVTRLECGQVEVVNLIADRETFDIALIVARAGHSMACAAGQHIIYAPADAASAEICGRQYRLMQDSAMLLRGASDMTITVTAGIALIGSIHAKGA